LAIRAQRRTIQARRCPWAETTIEAIIASGDENSAMALMALGASRLARQLHDAGQADGAIILGGTMGTDLALDVAAALPLGVPKFVVSTIAYSHLVPPERIAPDLMMILWAGGLYGLNDICRSVLSQACGAVVGAALRNAAVGRTPADRHDVAGIELPQIYEAPETGAGKARL
jgi:uncharacterized protein (UPF0261 family)